MTIGGPVSFYNSVIQGNDATKSGGGIAIIGPSSIVLSGTDLIANWTNGNGGAIYNSGGALGMNGGSIRANWNLVGDAGAVQSEGGSGFTDVSFSGNSTPGRGGAVNVAAQSTFLTGCTFDSTNSATGGGPKVAKLQGGVVEFTDCMNFNQQDIFNY